MTRGPLPRTAARAGRALLLWLACSAAVVALGVAAGAYGSGFGAFEDEPAHLVSGLMVRDWLAAGEWGTPVAFARETYRHLPKVAVGQWPPGWHGALGLWALACGASRVALLLLPALLSGAVLAWTVRRAATLGRGAGLLAGVLLLALPPFQASALSLMTEVPLTWVALLALSSWARHLEDGRGSSAWVTGAWAALALSIKGSALALAPACAAAALLAGRARRLARPAPWLAALAAAGLLVPWYLWTLAGTASTWEGGATPSWAYTERALRLYGTWTLERFGPGLLGLAALGLVWPGPRARAGVADDPGDASGPADAGPGALVRRERPVWLGWAIGWLAVHAVVPSSVEERHLVLVAPVLVLGAVRGAWLCAAALTAPRSGPRDGLAIALGFAALAVHVGLTGGPGLVERRYTGFEEAVAEASARATTNGRVLVVSDARGEGLLVAEAALAWPRPPRGAMLRASKCLADGDWLGQDVRPRFGSRGDLEAWLDRVGVQVLVYDRSLAEHQRFAHVDQVRALLDDPGSGWSRVRAVDVHREGPGPPGGLEIWSRPLDPAQAGELPPFEELVGDRGR